MTTQTEARPKDPEKGQVELSPEMRALIQEAVAKELHHLKPGVRPDWSVERMQAAMKRIVERRRRIGLPPDVVEQIIEEHRREFGRGPLVPDEDVSDDA
jgi:hypothetical protein